MNLIVKASEKMYAKDFVITLLSFFGCFWAMIIEDSGEGRFWIYREV